MMMMKLLTLVAFVAVFSNAFAHDDDDDDDRVEDLYRRQLGPACPQPAWPESVRVQWGTSAILTRKECAQQGGCFDKKCKTCKKRCYDPRRKLQPDGSITVIGGEEAGCPQPAYKNSERVKVKGVTKRKCLHNGGCFDKTCGKGCKWCFDPKKKVLPDGTVIDIGKPEDPCKDSPCKNGGQCSKDGATGFKCKCSAGYTGTMCLIPVDACKDSPCKNSGQCIKYGVTGFKCKCSAGYTGTTCLTPPDPCNNSPCKNGGQCSRDGATGFKCQCSAGYTGATCLTPPDPCNTSPCKNGGQCSKDGATGYKCRCSAGYTGATCLTAINPCASGPCKNGAACSKVGLTGYKCQCSAGWIGTTCTTRGGCPKHSGVSVTKSNTQLQTIFRNVYSEPVQMKWINFQGGLNDYATIAPGHSWTVRSYYGHRWMAWGTTRKIFLKINGECVWTVPAHPSTVALQDTRTALIHYCTAVSGRTTNPLGRPYAVRISLTNKFSKTVHIYWRDYSGNAKFYKTLGPNETFYCNSYYGHKWIAKVDGTTSYVRIGHQCVWTVPRISGYTKAVSITA